MRNVEERMNENSMEFTITGRLTRTEVFRIKEWMFFRKFLPKILSVYATLIILIFLNSYFVMRDFEKGGWHIMAGFFIVVTTIMLVITAIQYASIILGTRRQDGDTAVTFKRESV